LRFQTGANVNLLPEDSAARKTYPMFSGLVQYFPAALAAVAHHSYTGNEKHNPGQPLHHDRAKSGDEADALLRHLMEGDYVGTAWRALSLLQKDLEAKGAPLAPGARNVFSTAANYLPDSYWAPIVATAPSGLDGQPMTAEVFTATARNAVIPPDADAVVNYHAHDAPMPALVDFLLNPAAYNPPATRTGD
jgi:hypothetical protein